jgi:hypothetical protein
MLFQRDLRNTASRLNAMPRRWYFSLTMEPGNLLIPGMPDKDV